MSTRQEDRSGDNRLGSASPLAPWSFDPRDGALQGPLELGSFVDSGLRLQLARGQTALLTCAGEVRTVWLEGTHELAIGLDAGRLPPFGRLFMIAIDAPLCCRWSLAGRQSGGGHAPPVRPHGTCDFLVDGPVRFHETFLKHAETAGEGFVRRLLGALMQTRLEELLGTPEAAPDPWPRLTRLTSSDLAAGWEDLGVSLAAFSCDAPATAREDAMSRPAGQPAVVRV